MVRESYDQTTDTHLAKKYNDALYSCMAMCNQAGWGVKSSPHFETLMDYYAALDIFINNTFFLFETVMIDIGKGEKKSLTLVLIEKSNEIDEDVRNMKASARFRNPGNFHEVQNKVSYLHKMIMFGLQQRQMLVRMSEKEPRGAESIKYWDTKVGFRKGNIKSDVEWKNAIG